MAGLVLQLEAANNHLENGRAARAQTIIALKLGITERTVKAHLTSIYNKLGVDSRAAAIAIAAQNGWLHFYQAVIGEEDDR